MTTALDEQTIKSIVAEAVTQLRQPIHGCDLTLGQFFRQYIDHHASIHTRSVKDFERDFRLYLSPWTERQLIDIRRREVIELQAALFKEKGKSAANRTIELLSMLYNKAIEWEMVVTNPAARIRKFRLQPRERFLLPEEIPRFIAAVKALRHQTAKDYFLMLLFTGQRRRNVCEMRWDQIDFVRAVWRIPQTKNGTSHNVPLVREALEILERRRNDGDKHAEWVFPKRDGSGPIWSLDMAWQSVLRRAELEDFRLHDLRRSHASWQAITGVSTPIIGATLNHKDPKSTMIYARLYIDPVRDAMQQAVDAMTEYLPSNEWCQPPNYRGALKLVPDQRRLAIREPNQSPPPAQNKNRAVSAEEQQDIENKIIAVLTAGPRIKSSIHQALGGFNLSGFELQRIIDVLLSQGKIHRFCAAPHWRVWQYSTDVDSLAIT